MAERELVVKIIPSGSVWHAFVGKSPHGVTKTGSTTGSTPVVALQALVDELERLPLVSVWHMNVSSIS